MHKTTVWHKILAVETLTVDGQTAKVLSAIFVFLLYKYPICQCFLRQSFVVYSIVIRAKTNILNLNERIISLTTEYSIGNYN